MSCSSFKDLVEAAGVEETAAREASEAEAKKKKDKADALAKLQAAQSSMEVLPYPQVSCCRLR